MAGQRETGCRCRRRSQTRQSGFWPMAIVCTTAAVALQLFGGSTAFTILSPFSYSSLSLKNLLNSVLLSSNANLAGGGRNLKSDVLEDASLITVCIMPINPIPIQLQYNSNTFIHRLSHLSSIIHMHCTSCAIHSSYISYPATVIRHPSSSIIIILHHYDHHHHSITSRFVMIVLTPRPQKRITMPL